MTTLDKAGVEAAIRAIALADLDPETRAVVDLDAHLAHVRDHYEELTRFAITAYLAAIPAEHLHDHVAVNNVPPDGAVLSVPSVFGTTPADVAEVAGRLQKVSVHRYDDKKAIEEAASLLTRIAAERDAAWRANERDRTIITDARNAINDAIVRRSWLLSGRGSYEWDDDRWKEEFGAAIKEIEKPLEILHKLGIDWSHCPLDEASIKAGRIDWQARATAAEASNANLFRIIADIREASGLGAGPMLNDLASEIGRAMVGATYPAERIQPRDKLAGTIQKLMYRAIPDDYEENGPTKAAFAVADAILSGRIAIGTADCDEYAEIAMLRSNLADARNNAIEECALEAARWEGSIGASTAFAIRSLKSTTETTLQKTQRTAPSQHEGEK